MIHISAVGVHRAPYIEGHYLLGKQDDQLVYIPEPEFVQYYKHQEGQIRRGSPFGEELYKLAREGPAEWLEIGAWNGLGSTKCILDGFAERRDMPHLLSLELDPVLFEAAEQNLASHPARYAVEFRQGVLSSAKVFPFPDESILSNDDKNTPHYFINFEREKALYEKATPVVPAVAPQVAVLDGGEYSGGLDWLHLDKSNLQYLCLDDTGTFKNSAVVKGLGEQWTCIASGTDRLGWAIFKRV
jgi:hypothetical protein